MSKLIILLIPLIFITKMYAPVDPNLNICIEAGAQLRDEFLEKWFDKIPEDCLKPVLIEKITAKLFPQSIIQPKMILPAHKDSITSVAITPDGKIGLSGSEDETIKVWDLETGNEVFILPDHAQSIASVAISNNDKKGLSAAAQSIILWDLMTGKKIDTLQSPLIYPITSVATDENGARAIAGDLRGNVIIWDLLIRKMTGFFRAHNGPVNSVAVTPNGKIGVSGSEDEDIMLWNLIKNEKIGPTLDEHTDIVTSVAINSNGSTILSGSTDKTVRLWDLNNREAKILPSFIKNKINSVAMTPNGKTGIAGDDHGIITVWDLIRQKEIGNLIDMFNKSGEVNSVAITSDGATVLSGSEDGTLKVWDLRPLLIEHFFSIEGLKEVYHRLLHEDKYHVYNWIVELFKKKNQAESLERAKKEEQEQLERELLEESVQEGLQ